MALFKDNQFCDDTWVVLGDEQALDAYPPGSHLILSLPRLIAERDRLADVSASLGVIVPNTTEIDAISCFLHSVRLIVLEFPSFGDGRSYSLARQIRMAGFLGELRATGNLLPDQLQMMLQVGFTSLVVSERFPLGEWQKAGRQMSLVYQRGLYRQVGETDILAVRQKEFGSLK